MGWLSVKPMSGYEMRRQIEGSTGNFWQESFGQIYPTLKRLLGEGMVELVKDVVGERRTESKVYRLTVAGQERLEKWLESPSRPQVARNEMLLKIFFSGPVPVDVVRRQVRAFCERHELALQRYAGIEQTLRRDRGHDSRLPLWLMTLRFGQAESRAMVAWAEEALGMCDGIERERAV